MKSITLKEAMERLKETLVVIVDNDPLADLTLTGIKNKPENEFLYVFWEDEGKKHSLKFMEQDNQTIKVTDDGSSMMVKDSEGYKIQLTLLQLANY
jgi:hypothetical protein